MNPEVRERSAARHVRLRGPLGVGQDHGRGRSTRGGRVAGDGLPLLPGRARRADLRGGRLGVRALLPASVRRGLRRRDAGGGDGAGPDVRPPRRRRARGAPAHPRHRARDPPAADDDERRPDTRSRRLVPGAVSRASWHDGGGGPRRGRRLPRPHGALVHRVRRVGGTSTTPSRWRCSSGPSCSRASGERDGARAGAAASLLPPPRQGGPGGVRALRPPHLHGLHGVGRGRLAVPGVHRRRGRSARARSPPSRTPAVAGRASWARRTPPRW